MYTLKINILLYGSNLNTVINFLADCINLSINEVLCAYMILSIFGM